MAKAIFKAKEFTVKAKSSKEFVSEEMVRAKLFDARKKEGSGIYVCIRCSY